MPRFHNLFCLTKKKQLEIVLLQGKQKELLILMIFPICKDKMPDNELLAKSSTKLNISCRCSAKFKSMEDFSAHKIRCDKFFEEMSLTIEMDENGWLICKKCPNERYGIIVCG